MRKKTATQKEGSEDACRNAGKNSKPEAKLAYALGPLGNLFLLATLSELRRHRLTYLAFYALQRSIDEADQESDRPYSERRLRAESQLPDFERSRACSLLQRRGLVTCPPGSGDKWVRLLVPTEQGRSVCHQVMAELGWRLVSGIAPSARNRRVRVRTRQLRAAGQVRYGPWEPTFFDKDV